MSLSAEDADLALALLARDPRGLGGVVLRGWPDPARERAVARLSSEMNGAAITKVPPSVAEDRLLGGLDPIASIAAGAPRWSDGLLAAGRLGIIVLPMAERAAPWIVASIASALDAQTVASFDAGREVAASFAAPIVAFDEGLDSPREGEGPETIAPALADRLAFSIAIELPSSRALFQAPGSPPSPREGDRDVVPLDAVSLPDVVLEALARAAARIGVGGQRPLLLAARAAIGVASLRGHAVVSGEDAATAARLTLAWRGATAGDPEPRVEPSTSTPPPTVDREPPEPSSRDEEAPPPSSAPSAPPARDMVLEVVESAVRSELLDVPTTRARGRTAGQGRSGARARGDERGRPRGSRAPRGGPAERLHLFATLLNAAPWQRLRTPTRTGAPRIVREDVRVRVFESRKSSLIVFALDASGSSAMARLAEAKGAVQKLLEGCHARREHVAVVAFRGTSATLVVPPTRSLTRARRCLADLAGGGATPLAAGLDLALEVARDAERSGKTATVVVLTDGRANVGRASGNGAARGSAAMEDALKASREIAALGLRALLIDTSPRPRESAATIATAMAARYVPMPYLEAGRLARAVREDGHR